MKQDNDSYFGFSASSEFLQYEWDEFVNFVIGRCIMAIGVGDFKSVIRFSLSQAAAWGLYHNKPEGRAKRK